MASVIDKIAQKWNLARYETLLSGRINDIFVNLTFVKNTKKNVNMENPGGFKPFGAYLFGAAFQPKYEHVTVDLYVSRKEGINEAELSGFLDTNYETYKTSLPTYVNGHFGVALYQRDAVNVKAGYVIDFLDMLTGFLNEQGYFSGCKKCGSNDNLSQVYKASRATEICENCRLKEATL